MTKTRRIQPMRRLAGTLQAAVILGLPFLRINGESAVRFDVPTLRLFFLGSALWMDEFFIVLAAVIFLTFLIVLVTLVYGRIWCGWLCPQTVIIDLTAYMDRAKLKGISFKTASYAGILLSSILVAASLIWYFVSPYEFFQRLMNNGLGPVIGWSWTALTAILFLNFAFIRHRFCATVCPYAKLQSTLFDERTMLIAYDPGRSDECMDCRACVRVCPVNIDIRKGLSPACINCAECIDACAKRLEKKKRPGLIGYSFGLPGTKGPLLRLNAILMAVITLCSLIFLIYLSAVRTTIDMTVAADHSLQPRKTADGRIVNAYFLMFENRGKADAFLELRANGPEGPLDVNPSTMTVPSGGHKKERIFVRASAGQRSEPFDIDLSAATAWPDGKMFSKKATFIIPEER